MLDSRYATWLGWGPDFTFFYNDAYARMTLGPKHPWALGRPAREVWSEESYHTFSYSPVPDERGGVGGLLCVVTEDTERTVGERRLKTLRELAAGTTEEARSAEDACQTAVCILSGN